VRVELIETLANGRVRVRSPYGCFTAAWSTDTPAIGSAHDVELEVDDPLRWGHDIALDESRANTIVDDGPSRVHISARIHSVTEDGVLVLDIGGPSFMVDTIGDPPLGIVGCWVSLRSRHVTLWSYIL